MDLTPSEAAKRLGVSRQYIDQLIQAGKLRARPIKAAGRVVLRLIPEADVVAMVAARCQKKT